MMAWLSTALAALAALAGVRYLWRLRAGRESGGVPRVDDAALQRILATGSLPAEEPDALDMDAAARAEEEFWGESWDEPEEYHR
jgi:hypothetical protein